MSSFQLQIPLWNRASDCCKSAANEEEFTSYHPERLTIRIATAELRAPLCAAHRRTNPLLLTTEPLRKNSYRVRIDPVIERLGHSALRTSIDD